MPVTSQAGCEALFELYHGPHGTVRLGRMLRGIDSGRLVVLRDVTLLDPAVLAAVDLARSLAHPQLLKSLGVVQSATSPHLASEYVPGVSLLEFEASVRKSRFPLRPGVAVRIIKDALRAAAATQRLLSDTAAVSYTRCLFADTIWIAEFGDVLLTDVGVAPLLGKVSETDSTKAAAKDLLAAAIHLFQLATAEALSPAGAGKLASYVPELLAETLGRALGVDQGAPFTNIEQFLQALDQLPQELQADERAVNDELQRRVGASLAQRRNKLGLLELGAAKEHSEEVTRVFRSLLPANGTPDTVRPQAPAGDVPVLELPSAPKVAGRTSWQDEAPLVDRRPAATALARGSERPILPEHVPTRASARPPPSSNAEPQPTRSHKSRVLWLLGLGLLTALTVAWWAASVAHPNGTPALPH